MTQIPDGMILSDLGDNQVVVPKDWLERIMASREEAQRDSNWLTILESAGVDNWEGFSFAYDLKREAIESGDYEEEDFP